MGLYAIKPGFQRFLAPVAGVCVMHRVGPDHLNVVGLLASVGMGGLLLLASQHSVVLLLMPTLIFVRLASNALDGMVARSTGISSAMGELHNEILDRLSDCVVVLSIGLGDLGSMPLAGCACAAMMLNSTIGVACKAAGGQRVYRGIMGKPDRMVLVGATALASYWIAFPVLWDACLVAVLAGSIVSSMQRYLISRKELAR